jgi:hypothetical protein
MARKLDPKTEALLQAHVEHTIKQLQDFDTIRAEVAALFKALTETPLSTLVALERLQKIAKERLLDIAPTHQLRTEIANIVKDGLKNKLNKKTLITDLIPDATVETIVGMIANDTAGRNKIIHEIFSNPTTGEVLSTTISHAIKDYMENNVVTKKIPGAAGLMKFGKGMLEKATDSNFDDALQNYLSRNIRNIMNISEKKTQDTLSNHTVNRLATDIWQKLKVKSIESVTQLIHPSQVDESSHLVMVLWNHIRSTKYAQSIVAEALSGWYARNSNRSIIELLADVNVTPEFVVSELEPALAETLKHLADTGYLQDRVEPLLRQFYASAAVTKIMTA